MHSSFMTLNTRLLAEVRSDTTQDVLSRRSLRYICRPLSTRSDKAMTAYWLWQNARILTSGRWLISDRIDRSSGILKAGNADDAIQWHLLLIMTVSDYSQYCN